MKCLNCEKPLQPADAYCSGCGQSASTGRLQTPHILHHFYHAFTHTDKGFFYLIKELLVKPGIIAREYNEGKRKTYFSPFTFVIILIAINTFLAVTFDMMNADVKQDVIRAAMNKYFNLVIFITLPLMGYFTSLLFKKRGINFAEGVVLAAYTSGERSIFSMIIIVPLLVLFREHYDLIINTYLVLYLVYYAWACCQYVNDYKTLTWVKGGFVFILTQIVLTALISIVYVVYHFTK